MQRPRTQESYRRLDETSSSSRPETPAYDDGFARARQILKQRVEALPKLPGIPGQGIGLKIAELPHMGRSYINQYISASLKVLENYERALRADRQLHANSLRSGGQAEILDVFDRAELPDVKKRPLLSQLHTKTEAPVPRRPASQRAMREPSAQDVLQGRLLAIQRIARNDPVLAHVRLCHEQLDDDWAVAVADALTMNFQLESLMLVANNITDVGGQPIARAVGSHPTLATVALGGNRIGDKTAFAFARALLAGPCLAVLNLSAPKYHRHYLRALAVISRDAGKNDDDDDDDATVDVLVPASFDAATWGQTAPDDEGVRTAERIGPLGVRALARSLSASRLVELNLSGQAAGDDGAKAIATALAPIPPNSAIPALAFLTMEACNIRDNGVIDLCSALFSRGNHSHLRSLRLAQNYATTVSADPIARDLIDIVRRPTASHASASTHLHLDISMNQIGTDGCAALDRACRMCRDFARSSTASVTFHGNPGYVHRESRRPQIDACRVQDFEDRGQILPMGLPLRLGETVKTDSGRNLAHIRVSTAALREKLRTAGHVDQPNFEPFTQIAMRAATARTTREMLGRTEAFRLKKRRLLVQREAIFQPRSDLPPVDFITTLHDHARYKRLDLPPLPRLNALGGTSRVGTALNLKFRRIVSTPNARFGRLDGLDMARPNTGPPPEDSTRHSSAVLPRHS